MAPRLKRWLAPLVAAALLSAACGDSDDPTPGVGTSTSSSLAAPAPEPTPSSGAAQPSTTGRRPATPTSGASPSTARAGNDAAIAEAADSQPGAFAGVILGPGLASRIELDVLVQAGASADAATTARVVEHLRSLSGKPVALSGPRQIPASGNVHTAAAIRTIADERGTSQGHDDTAVLHLIYLNGAFEREGVLGVTVRGDTTAVFPDAIAGAATPFVSPARIERSVVVHELGHILGLVDLYLGTKRGDPQHPGHSRNAGSVMYWAVESSVIGQVLDGPPPVDFDAADLADLGRIQKGAPAGS